MESSKDLTQHARRDEFTRRLTEQPVLPEWATNLREQFRHACKDEGFLTRRVLKALVHSSAVYGCTLSILGRLSLGAPLFDIVVVDEAAKASLPECMIAALSVKRLVLVGDHLQVELTTATKCHSRPASFGSIQRDAAKTRFPCTRAS